MIGRRNRTWDEGEVYSIAASAAVHFDRREEASGEALLERLVSLYVSPSTSAARSGWPKLPPLESVIETMTAKFASSGLRGGEQRHAFFVAVSERFRRSIQHAVPSLAVMTTDPEIGLNATVHAMRCILHERDRAVEVAASSTAGFVGRIRVKLGAPRPEDVGVDFMRSVPPRVLSYAVAMSALQLGQWSVMSVDNRKRDSAAVEHIIELAREISNDRHVDTLRVLEEAQALANELHVSEATSRPAPAGRSFGF